MKKMAILATLHCLIGCMIGELIGLEIGRIFDLGTGLTIGLAVVLSFVFGYIVSTIPLVRSGMSFWSSLKLVFAVDTLSILTMTIVDNLVMLSTPGAMDKDPSHIMYWSTRLIALAAAFVVAVPVNYWLLKRGKGHALTHHQHGHNRHHHSD